MAGSNYFHQGADVKCGPNGEVYVVWTCADADISPYTEDSLGLQNPQTAESTGQ